LIVAQQVRVGLDGPEVVDGDNLDVGASALHDRAQHVAADASEPVDCNSHGHVHFLI
jgi:hypothetical protein